MGGPTYTVEQLERLKESPLVKKPDGLPSILQWMEVPADQQNNTNPASNSNNNNNTSRRARGNGRDGDAAGDRADRPLINPMGQFGRRPSQQPEDTVLGPPKLAFASASRAVKGAEDKRTGIISIDGDQLGDRFPRERNERWRDRDGDRPRDKGFPNGRRAGREEGEGWTSVKGRKSLGQDEFDRGFGRNGDRDREKKDVELDADAPPRRGGNRDKFDRWARRDENNTKEAEGNRFSGGQGGWRDRERDRERDKERDWTRGKGLEEDPEWMDSRTPVDSRNSKKEPKAHTQEDFQRWKESMRAKDTPTDERDDHKIENPSAKDPPASIVANQPIRTALTPTVEAGPGGLFGNWGKDKSAEITGTESISAKAKPAQKSRFMTMFAKPEEPAAPSPPVTSNVASPEPPADNSNADKEGFQRILQMLGGAAISSPQPMAQGNIPPPPTNGARQGGIPLDFQHQSPPPEPQDNRPNPRQQPPRTLEQQNMLEHILAPRPSGPESRPSQQAMFSMSPDNALLERFNLPRAESNRPEQDFPIQQPPSRNNNAPQDANLAAILNNRAQHDANRDRETKQRERDFLLTLMQQPSRATPPQMHNQNLPRPSIDQNMPFFEQAGPRPQGQNKGRGGPPPAYMDEARAFAETEMMLRQQQIREMTIQQQQQEAMRNKNPRMPMGFPGHEDPALAGLQRRNTAGEIPRQMTNMGIPSQPVPDMPYMGGRQPGMPPTPQDRPNIPPPPGFGGPMRQPPGLAGPGPHQQMGPGPLSAGNTPLGHPPGFGPPGNVRGGPFPGPGNGMQVPPQGYFPPPGYAPHMALRGGEDPRMMFEQFGGPNPRQPGRPGPPPNMY